MGAKASQSSQESQGSSNSLSGSYLDQGQSPFLQNMWQQASSLAGGQNAGQFAQGQADSAMGYMDAGLQGMQGLADPTAQIRTQTDALQTELGNMWNNTIMPGIQSDAIAAGGMGGGRQGVAEGVGAGAMADAFSSGYADITGRANAQALQAQTGLIGGAMDRYNLGMSPQAAAWGPLQQLSGILGPAIQQQFSQSNSQQTSSGSNQSAGFSIFG